MDCSARVGPRLLSRSHRWLRFLLQGPFIPPPPRLTHHGRKIGALQQSRAGYAVGLFRLDKTYASLLQNSSKRRDESKALRDLAMGKTENHKILPARLRAMNRMDFKRLFKRTYASHSIAPVRPACVCLESLAQRLNLRLVGNASWTD